MKYGTINYIPRRMGKRSKGVVGGKPKVRGEDLPQEGCAMEDGVAHMSLRRSTRCTIVDWMVKIPLGGLGKLNFWCKYLAVSHQRYIYEEKFDLTI